MKKRTPIIPLLLYLIFFGACCFLFFLSMAWWVERHLLVFKILPTVLPILLWLMITKLLTRQRKANSDSNCYEGASAIIEAPFFAIQFLCVIGFVFSLLFLCAE